MVKKLNSGRDKRAIRNSKVYETNREFDNEKEHDMNRENKTFRKLEDCYNVLSELLYSNSPSKDEDMYGVGMEMFSLAKKLVETQRYLMKEIEEKYGKEEAEYLMIAATSRYECEKAFQRTVHTLSNEKMESLLNMVYASNDDYK